MNNWLSRIPKEYLAYLALAVWGGMAFMLLNKTNYGLDEGGAHALLLVWSVADGVVSSIVTLGLPDFRTLFFIPAGVLWTGNVVAAKMTSMLVMAMVAWALHNWRKLDKEQEESSLLATGLLLISPLTLHQIDAISVAPFLLFVFAMGAWTDKIYRESKQALGGMYFAQIFLCLISVTLHPMGLAYPLVLLWTWYKNPLDKERRNYLFAGILSALVIALVLTMGWRHVEWFANPVGAASSLLLGPSDGGDLGIDGWIFGVGMLCLLLWIVISQAVGLWADLLGRILLAALVIGLFVGDEIFGMVALVLVLYWGLPMLLSRPVNEQGGFWRQRGIALILIFVVSTVYMLNDKASYQAVLLGELSPRDTLIRAFVENAAGIQKDETAHAQAHGNDAQGKAHQLRVASQWPGATMLACRCDALPLPPEARDSAALYAMLKGVDYLLFDPHNPANRSLSRNLATMQAGLVETVDLRKGGVIVQVGRQAIMPAPAAVKQGS